MLYTIITSKQAHKKMHDVAIFKTKLQAIEIKNYLDCIEAESLTYLSTDEYNGLNEVNLFIRDHLVYTCKFSCSITNYYLEA